MSPVWKFLLPVAVLLPLGGYVAGSLASSVEDPAPRQPIILENRGSTPDPTSPRATPSRSPEAEPSEDPDDADGDDDGLVSPDPFDDGDDGDDADEKGSDDAPDDDDRDPDRGGDADD